MPARKTKLVPIEPKPLDDFEESDTAFLKKATELESRGTELLMKIKRRWEGSSWKPGTLLIINLKNGQSQFTSPGITMTQAIESHREDYPDEELYLHRIGDPPW